jgi:hypothetical protein
VCGVSVECEGDCMRAEWNDDVQIAMKKMRVSTTHCTDDDTHTHTIDTRCCSPEWNDDVQIAMKNEQQRGEKNERERVAETK